MDERLWQQAHRARLEQRCALLRAQPDGVVYESSDGLHHIRIIKHMGQLQFYFIERSSGALDGPMSRIDLARPLHLLAEYTQAAMLSLLWRPDPARVCLLGLAGGRISLIFYHYIPSVAIDNVDIDPAVVPIATSYFGLTFDERQSIAICDVREYIESLPAARLYDIIVLDAFGDTSETLDHLATVECFQACQRHLLRGGVLCVNILNSDPRLLSKVKTIQHCFRHVGAVEQKHGLVLFATDQAALGARAIAQRAQALQHRHQFEFPLLDRAAALRPLRELPAYQSRVLRDAPLLRDAVSG